MIRKDLLKQGRLFSNYCGLGGDGPISSEFDYICSIHDRLYGDILKHDSAINTYVYLNNADRYMYEMLQHVSEPTILSERAFFHALKKYINLKQMIGDRTDEIPYEEYKLLNNFDFNIQMLKVFDQTGTLLNLLCHKQD